MKGKELARKLVSIVCVTGTTGIALKLLTFCYQSEIQGFWHYFPIIPNIFDTMFLIFAVLWLAFRR